MEKIDLQRPVRTVEEYGYSQKPIIFKKMAYIFVNENDDNDFLITDEFGFSLYYPQKKIVQNIPDDEKIAIIGDRFMINNELYIFAKSPPPNVAEGVFISLTTGEVFKNKKNCTSLVIIDKYNIAYEYKLKQFFEYEDFEEIYKTRIRIATQE